MGTSSLAANLDGKVIHCAYLRDIQAGESAYPMDLAVSVKHQYVNSVNIVNEIVLEEFVISKDYLETKGLAGVSDVEQALEFHVLNLRYLNDIFIELREVRDSVPVLTRVPVLSDTSDADPLPVNPMKYAEHDENISEIKPDVNVSIHSNDAGVIYSMSETPLLPIQSSKRIYLVEENGEQIFTQVDYNELSDRIFIENSISNLIPNPQFVGTDKPDKPDAWNVDTAGIVLNSYIQPGDIENTNFWRIRASNSNVFNAFNHVSLLISDKHNMYSGLNALTFSTYYRVSCDSKNIPFNNFNVKLNFFFNDSFIRSEESTLVVTDQLKTWTLLSSTFSEIPLTANKYTLELDLADIDTTELFTLDLYLPQLEASPCATTRTVDSKIQDKLVTGSSFELNPSFFIFARTHFVSGVGNRGLFSSTTNQANGIEFLASNDRLRFKQYGVAGNIVLNFASNHFPALENGSIVDYGIWVTATSINFYLNGVMLSSHPCTFAISQNKSYLVGSLEKSNTTINTELLDFKVLRFMP